MFMMLSFFFQSQKETQGSDPSWIAKDMLCNLLRDTQHGSGGLQQQLLAGLKAEIDKRCSVQSGTSLLLVLDLLAEVTKSTDSTGVVSWLVQEGGLSIIARYQVSYSQLENLDVLLDSLILILNNLLKAKTRHDVDRNFFLKKFILAIDLVAVIIVLTRGDLPDALDDFENHPWAEEFLITERPDIKDLVLPDGPVFFILSVCSDKIAGPGKRRKTSFLHFLLWLLFNGVLKFRNVKEVYLSQCKDFVCSCVDEWQKDDDAECSVMLLKCVAALKAVSVWDLPFGKTSDRKHRLRFEPFWDLMIEHGSSNGLDMNEKRRLMLLLKTSYTSDLHDEV